MTHRARNAASGVILAERLRAADTHWSRLKGLLGTRSLEAGDGLWLKPCRQVHMIGMRYAVDLAFLDDGNRVVRTIGGLAPGKLSPRVAGASSVLELPLGTLARTGLTVGNAVEIEGDPVERGRGRRRLLGAFILQLVLAVLFGFFASAHFAAARTTGRWATTMPMVAQEALLVLLLLTRRRGIATSSRPVDWAIAVCATFLPLLMRPADALGGLSAGLESQDGKNRASSRSADPGESLPWIRFSVTSMARSPRIVPGAEAAGSVAPISARTTATASRPDTRATTTSPPVMNLTSSP